MSIVGTVTRVVYSIQSNHGLVKYLQTKQYIYTTQSNTVSLNEIKIINS